MRIHTCTAGPFAENGYLVECGEGVAVAVDPGAGARTMVEILRGGELSLAAVLLTHAHLDHVDGLSTLLDEADAPVYLHPDARAQYDALPEQAKRFGMPLDRPPPPPDEALAHGETLAFGSCAFQVREAPGHAPGHVIFWEEEEGAAFVGDVVFRGSIGRTDLPGGDYRVLMRSIREQVLTLPDETRLYTGHGPDTTVEQERTGNPFLIPHYGGELA